MTTASPLSGERPRTFLTSSFSRIWIPRGVTSKVGAVRSARISGSFGSAIGLPPI